MSELCNLQMLSNLVEEKLITTFHGPFIEPPADLFLHFDRHRIVFFTPHICLPLIGNMFGPR